MAEVEYNDFGFTAMDADELASVDTKIVETTTTAKAVIEKLDKAQSPEQAADIFTKVFLRPKKETANLEKRRKLSRDFKEG